MCEYFVSAHLGRLFPEYMIIHMPILPPYCSTKIVRTFFFCTLATGLLLLPASNLQAAAAISGGAKKAPKQKITRQVSKASPKKLQPVQKGKIVRLEADAKEQVATHKAKPAHKQVKSRTQNTKPAQVAAKKTRTVKAVQTAEVRTQRRGVSATTAQAPAGSPFLKKKATLDEQTRLANTLQDQLGVEVMVQDNRAHSGGLFIAPPSTDTGADNATKALDLLANLPLGRPIDAPISSRFGGRQDPVNGRRAFHEGVDFQARMGEKVNATANGRVVSSSYSPDYGENIIISHGKGYETMFAHLSKRLVQVGDSIAPGDVVGLVGNSGRSTGAHLHYEIRYRGAPINPMDYMRATQQARLQKK